MSPAGSSGLPSRLAVHIWEGLAGPLGARFWRAGPARGCWPGHAGGLLVVHDVASAGRSISWRNLFSSALATGICWVGMEAVLWPIFCDMVISDNETYGPIRVVFSAAFKKLQRTPKPPHRSMSS